MFILAHPLHYWPAFVWVILNAIALGIVLGAFSLAIQRKDFQDSARLNHWLFISFVMVCLWLIKAQVMDNLYIHLIGASVALLILGAPLALLALACTTLVTSIILHTSPWIWGLQYLMASVIPLSTVGLLHYLLKKWLPHRLFVYIFVRGFFAAAIGMTLAMLINLTLGQSLTTGLGRRFFERCCHCLNRHLLSRMVVPTPVIHWYVMVKKTLRMHRVWITLNKNTEH